MKKNHISKLALMGILSGSLLSSAEAAEKLASAEANNNLGSVIELAKGCGQHSCEGSNGANSRNQPSSYTANRDATYDSLAEAKQEEIKAVNGKRMTESDLKAQLNEKGKALYDGLDSEGKSLALKLANGDCKGKNDCKGMSSCKTNNNDCAGNNGCKGQGNAKFSDKNLAVKVASKKMSEKRLKINGNK